jgi:hypothetical protein
MASPSSAVALIAEPTFGTAAPRCGRWPQAWPVTTGSNTSALPNRDIVPAAGYKLGDILTVRVLRNRNVERTAKGPRLKIAKVPSIGSGLEVDQGPAGRHKPRPGTRRTRFPRESGTSRNTTFPPSAAQAFRGAPTSQQASHRPQPDSTRVDQTVVSEEAGQRADPAPGHREPDDTSPVAPGNSFTLLIDGR